jgi:hypothetical protein
MSGEVIDLRTKGRLELHHLDLLQYFGIDTAVLVTFKELLYFWYIASEWE